MKIIPIILIFALLPTLLYAQFFERINGTPSMTKKSFVTAYKKNKKWVEGKINSTFEIYYNRDGETIKEIEKNASQTILQKNYIYKNENETSDFCDEVIKRNRKVSSFSEIEETQLYEICNSNKSRKMKMKIQYVMTPQEKTPKPFKTYFLVNLSKKTREYVLDQQNMVEYIVEKSIDKNKNISEEIKYDYEMKQLEKKLYKYSTSPLTVTFKLFDENDILKKETVKEYRPDNTLRKITETTYDKLEQIFSKNEIDCSSQQLPTNEKQYSAEGELQSEISYSYEFDDKANWIKMFKTKTRIVYGKRMSDEIPPEITTREITYF